MEDLRLWQKGKDERPWFEVIAEYDERFISEEVDTLVWEILSLGGFEHEVPPDLRSQLLRALPGYGVPSPLPADAVPRLRTVRDDAVERVKARRWHPEARLRVIRKSVRSRYA